MKAVTKSMMLVGRGFCSEDLAFGIVIRIKIKELDFW